MASEPQGQPLVEPIEYVSVAQAEDEVGGAAGGEAADATAESDIRQLAVTPAATCQLLPEASCVLQAVSVASWGQTAVVWPDDSWDPASGSDDWWSLCTYQWSPWKNK